MYHGRNNGKNCLAIKIIKQAFEIISLVTNKNPLEVVVKVITVSDQEKIQQELELKVL